jgi:hypothetical protein
LVTVCPLLVVLFQLHLERVLMTMEELFRSLRVNRLLIPRLVAVLPSLLEPAHLLSKAKVVQLLLPLVLVTEELEVRSLSPLVPELELLPVLFRCLLPMLGILVFLELLNSLPDLLLVDQAETSRSRLVLRLVSELVAHSRYKLVMVSPLQVALSR